jgi:hypothetical protein
MVEQVHLTFDKKKHGISILNKKLMPMKIHSRISSNLEEDSKLPNAIVKEL